MAIRYGSTPRMSEVGDRVGGTYGGGRRGEPVSVGDVLANVLRLVGSDPLRFTTTPVREGWERSVLREDPDLSYLQEKLDLSPQLVASMRLHYGREATIEALRQMEGRPRHPAYFTAVVKRIARGEP